MSYDIYLCKNGETVTLDKPHDLRGGTYQMGGCTEAWLNITYNYCTHFHRVFGEKGIRAIYGLTASESIPILRAAADKLGTDTNPDYWKATEGNARKSIMDLVSLAELAPPDSVWQGD